MHISHAPTFCPVLEDKSFCRLPSYSAFKLTDIQQPFGSQSKHQTHARVATLKRERFSPLWLQQAPSSSDLTCAPLEWPLIVEDPGLYTQPSRGAPCRPLASAQERHVKLHCMLITRPVNQCISHYFIFNFLKKNTCFIRLNVEWSH